MGFLTYHNIGNYFNIIIIWDNFKISFKNYYICGSQPSNIMNRLEVVNNIKNV